MRLPPSPYYSATAAAAALLLLPLADANSWNCEAVAKVGKEALRYDFHKLAGVQTIHTSEKSSAGWHNTTWQINPCGPIMKEQEKDSKEQCPHGTQVCGVFFNIPDDTKQPTEIMDVIPVAGGHVDVKSDRLKDSDSSEDKDKDGIRVRLYGSKYYKTPQEAIIDFICDPKRTGLEKGKGKKEAEKEGGKERRKREDKDEDEVPEDDKPSLQFLGYDRPAEGASKLRLKWLTKYACEDYVRNPNKDGGDNTGGVGSSSHWGFFTWCFVILFLGVAAYLIFGSWLNYNRYGARGWDLLPHGDTIRDLPYLLKDFLRKVGNTLQGGGARGGYSAV